MVILIFIGWRIIDWSVLFRSNEVWKNKVIGLETKAVVTSQSATTFCHSKIPYFHHSIWNSPENLSPKRKRKRRSLRWTSKTMWISLEFRSHWNTQFRVDNCNSFKMAEFPFVIPLSSVSMIIWIRLDLTVSISVFPKWPNLIQPL